MLNYLYKSSNQYTNISTQLNYIFIINVIIHLKHNIMIINLII